MQWLVHALYNLGSPLAGAVRFLKPALEWADSSVLVLVTLVGAVVVQWASIGVLVSALVGVLLRRLDQHKATIDRERAVADGGGGE
jgi:hypothetical protein